MSIAVRCAISVIASGSGMHLPCGRWKVYFCAQPVGQAATSTMTPDDATRLGGEVGDAINASGLVHARVYYELNPETGKSEFVDVSE